VIVAWLLGDITQAFRWPVQFGSALRDEPFSTRSFSSGVLPIPTKTTTFETSANPHALLRQAASFQAHAQTLEHLTDSQAVLIVAWQEPGPYHYSSLDPL
jgi:hypothetical protein